MTNMKKAHQAKPTGQTVRVLRAGAPTRPRQLYTVAESAQALGMSKAAIREWIWRRRIPVHRLGRSVRISSDTIDKLLADSLVPADERLALVD